MDKIAVVTDSTCDLDAAVLQKLNVAVLPLKVIYRDREYTDRVDITPAEIFKNLDREVPRTSLPSPGETNSLFEKLRDQGITHVLCLHISSGLSGTMQMVRTVAEEFKGMVIKVLDSKSLSWGVGFPVLEAARKVQEGGTFEQVVTIAEEVISRIQTFFVVGTLEYLKKGGRIGYVAGSIGELLQVKPIVSINDEGKYYTYDKVRGRKKSLQRMFEIIQEKTANQSCKAAVCHGDAEEEARDLADKIKELKNIQEVFFGQIGPVMVVHSGPGLVGVVLY